MKYQVLVVVVEATEKALTSAVQGVESWGIIGRDDYTLEEAESVLQNAEDAYRDD